jgi:hypothetical protein
VSTYHPAVPYANNGKFMGLNQAMKYWQPVAYARLQEVAKTYNAYITYKDLGDHVMAATGITYNWNYQWVGKLLGPIVHRCRKDGYPALTSLVVRQEDQSVGLGYDENLRAEGLPVPPDDDLATKQTILDEHAALARYQCYKFFGAEMPPDGGKPTLTPMVRAAKETRGEGVEW